MQNKAFADKIMPNKLPSHAHLQYLSLAIIRLNHSCRILCLFQSWMIGFQYALVAIMVAPPALMALWPSLQS